MPRQMSMAIMVMVCLLTNTIVFGQSTITDIGTTTSAGTSSVDRVTTPDDASSGISANTTYDVLYGTGNDVFVNSYTVGPTTYNRFLRPDTLILNRAEATDRLVNIWYEWLTINTGTNPDQLGMAPTAAIDADAIYLTGTLNAGYDNILVNTDNLAEGSIQVQTERVDVIWNSGIQTSTPDNAVFPIIERGGNDNIAIAAITSLNSDGTPASYGTLRGVAEDFWPGPGQDSVDFFMIMRREVAGSDPLPLLGQGTQYIQGVAVTFTELGVAANQSIYGYSLFPADVCDGFISNTNDALVTGVQTVKFGIDLTDIGSFPNDTRSDDTGLDLVAGVSAAVASDDNLIETVGPGGYKSALATWLKANESDLVTSSSDGAGVTLWDDRWLGNNDATTSVGSPTYRSTSSAINFNPTIDFGTTDNTLTIANNDDFNTATSYENKSINIAFRTGSNVSTRQVIYEQGGTTRGIIAYIRGSNLAVTAYNRNNDGAGSPWNNGANVVVLNTTVATDTEYILTLELDGNSSSSGSATAYLNGASYSTRNGVGLLYSDTDGIEVGGSDGTSQYDDGTNAGTNSFRGEISEFIYCNEPASFPLAQRRRIESYLAIKYGITLDQSSPIDYLNSDGITIFDATNNASIGGFLEYNNDIAGIGRDDNSELDQPASKSENLNSVVTIDKGSTIGTDDTWLIWGHDGAALTETAALTMPDTIQNRLNRVWRAAERNEVGTTSVSFDLSGLGLSTSQNDFSLLIAGNGTNADFSNATVVTGGTLNGNILTFTGVDIDDREYFTLGTQYFQCGPGGVFDNLALWLKANDGTSTTTENGDIATWSDQSGNSNNATAVVNNQPSYLSSNMNYNAAVDFDESNTEEITGSAGFHSVGYYIVFNSDKTVTSASDEEVLIGFNSPAGVGTNNEFGTLGLGAVTGAFSGEVITHAIGGGTGTGLARWRRGISSANVSQINTDQVYLLGIRDNAASGATSTEMYVDGRELANLTENSTFFTSANVDYEIGSYTATNDFANANHFDGQIAEVISYSVRPTDAEHVRIQSYLAFKYGITLDNTGGGTAGDYVSASGLSTIWDASDYATYHNDVAGIGRDDLSCLNQLQSQSENSNSIVSMGLGTIAASNSANPNSFSADGSFLMWGDDADNADQANANTTDLPGNVTERMERIWRVNETGTVGATSISFDLTGLNYGTTLSDFQLIVSNSSTMASGTLTPAASLVNNILTFNNVDLTDGQYFTIGTSRTACGPGGVTSGLRFLVRGDAAVTGTSNVTQWDDQSGNGFDATATTGPELFTSAVNFNPALQFNGTNETMQVTNGIMGTNTFNDMFVYVVNQTNTVQSSSVFFETLASASERLNVHIPWSDNNIYWDYGVCCTTGRISTNWGTSTGNYHFWTLGSSSGTSTPSGTNKAIYRDGAVIATNNQSDTGTGNNNNLYIGSSNGSTSFHAGDVAELIFYTQVPTVLEKERIETYLAIKYGIFKNSANNTSTPSTDERDYFTSAEAVIWDYSNNTAYHHDVAGIGRDDDSCLNQKQSTSVSTDDILTVGLGSIASSNANNANGFDDNGDFLVWGNDDASTLLADAITNDVPGTVSQRMARVWKVEDTGNVGATELQFDLTNTNFSVADASAFSLLVGSSATMANANVITGGTLNGSVLSFSNVDLTDGQFFTIGTAFSTCGPGGVNTNLSLWLRADLEVFSDAGSTAATDGGNVIQWNDQSSPANNGSETDLGGISPIEPTFETNEINFNPVLRFTDANSSNASYIETGSNGVTGDMTLISVFRSGQASGVSGDFVNSPALISGRTSNSPDADFGMGLENGTIYVNASSDADDFDAETTNTFNNNNVHFATATRTSSSGAITIYVDSNQETTGTGSTGALNTPTSFGIGNHSDSDLQAQFSGDIAETIVFSSVLSANERTRVETYLALKYGITRSVGSLTATEQDYLAADGGIIWDYDNQGTTYHNDLFGIGRDDLSCLDQTQSKSENSDAIVTFNLNGSFSSDDSFLISGNDNAALEEDRNFERPAGINSRLNREWRVQETGTVGTIQLTFDLSNITGPSGIGTNNASLLRLMVDNDGDFTTTDQLISPASIDGTNNTVTFNVDFTTGQYYTLGSTEVAALPVDLLSFSARTLSNGHVQLNWSTVSESNNAFFNIERSPDGINFESIGTREGAGDSEDILEYSFLDIYPQDGQNFYRLRQNDFNGEFEYSEVVRVYVAKGENDNRYLLYPNPVSRAENLTLAYQVKEPEILSIEMVSPNGTRTYSATLTIDSLQGEVELPTARLSKGLHFLRIREESGKVLTLKVLVN